MTTENALPGADTTAAAGATDPNVIEGAVNEVSEGDQKAEAAPQEAKPEKTPEQREIDRLRRGIDRKTRQLAEARAHANLTRQPIERTNQQSADDSEHLSLTRAQIRELVTAEAAKLAPTIREQATEVERRQGVVQGLTKTWGETRFNELSSDLDEAFDGLMDRSGAPRPATEAIFEADDPAKVIEYLADPENSEDAERISRMSAAQAGKAIAKLEAKLAATPAKTKPAASKAPAPLEAIRGAGPASKAPAQMTDAEYAKWRKTGKA